MKKFDMYEDYDLTEEVGQSYNLGIDKTMYKSIKSAVVSGLIAGILAILADVIHLGTIFAIDWHTLVNDGVIAAFVAIVSLLKAGGTNAEGDFLGVVKIK